MGVEFLVYDSTTKAWTESFNTCVATIMKLVTATERVTPATVIANYKKSPTGFLRWAFVCSADSVRVLSKEVFGRKRPHRFVTEVTSSFGRRRFAAVHTHVVQALASIGSSQQHARDFGKGVFVVGFRESLRAIIEGTNLVILGGGHWGEGFGWMMYRNYQPDFTDLFDVPRA